MSSMPTAQQEELKQQYMKYQEAQKAKKSKEQKAPLPKDKGFSPRELGMKRPSTSNVDLTSQVRSSKMSPSFNYISPNLAMYQVELTGGDFGFGSQLDHLGKITPAQSKDGADPRKKVTVQ